MKLLFFISSLHGGGAERVMVVLCNELTERGHEVYLATNIDIPFAYEIDDRIKIIDLYPKRSDKRNIANKIRNRLRTYSRIREVVKETKPDVATSFMLGLNTEVLISTIDIKTPIIASEHSTFDIKYSPIKYIKRFHINKLAAFVTILTQYDYEFIGDRLKNKIIMPNPLSFDICKGKDQREQVILAAGSIDRWEGKGFDNLIKVWGTVSLKFPNWKLQIAGNGKEENFEFLRKIAKDNDVEHSVEFLGFQSNLDQLLQQKAIFVLSSRYEGLPMILIEAMSQGASCIAFDCKTGPNEIIIHNESGILVEDQNMEEMEKSLVRLISDEALRNKLSEGGLKEAEKFSVDKIVDKWETLFKRAIKK